MQPPSDLCECRATAAELSFILSWARNTLVVETHASKGVPRDGCCPYRMAWQNLIRSVNVVACTAAVDRSNFARAGQAIAAYPSGAKSTSLHLCSGTSSAVAAAIATTLLFLSTLIKIG